MKIDLSTPVQQARFLVRLNIYTVQQIEDCLTKDFSLPRSEVEVIVAEAIEFDKRIDA